VHTYAYGLGGVSQRAGDLAVAMRARSVSSTSPVHIAIYKNEEDVLYSHQHFSRSNVHFHITGRSPRIHAFLQIYPSALTSDALQH
jgi:hypothetical protein